MLSIITKERAFLMLLEGKEVKGFMKCGPYTEEDVDNAPSGLLDGDYQCQSVSQLLDEYAFFLADVDQEEMKSDKKDKPGKTRKNSIDVGKIIALHKAGWSYAKIADEMGISVQTVLKYVRQYHERNEREEQKGNDTEEHDYEDH